MSHSIDNLRISNLSPLIKPSLLLQELPLSFQGSNLVYNSRTAIEQIIKGLDDRLLVVVGPCSIHDVDAAIEYAAYLQQAIIEHQETLCIVMLR